MDLLFFYFIFSVVCELHQPCDKLNSAYLGSWDSQLLHLQGSQSKSGASQAAKKKHCGH